MNISPHRSRRSPQEVKFRDALRQDKKAQDVVDKVDTVREKMLDMNDGKYDMAQESPNVVVQHATGTIRRGIGKVFNGPLEDIAVLAPGPEDDQDATIYGFLNDSTMSVDVEFSPEAEHSFWYKTEADGSKVYTSGGDTVTMNPDGSYNLVSA